MWSKNLIEGEIMMRNLLKVSLALASVVASGSVMSAQVVVPGTSCQTHGTTMSQMVYGDWTGVTNTSTSALLGVFCPLPNMVTAGASVTFSVELKTNSNAEFYCTLNRQFGPSARFYPTHTTGSYGVMTLGSFYTVPADTLTMSCVLPKGVSGGSYIRNIKMTW